MKIQSKLFLLVGGSLLVLATAGLVYSVFVSPVDRMDRERKTLENLLSSVRDLRIQVNRLGSETFGREPTLFKESREAYLAASQAIPKIVFLPTVSPAIRTALDVVSNLSELSEKRLNQVTGAYTKVLNDAQGILLSPSSATVEKFSGRFSSQTPQEQITQALADVGSLRSQVRILDTGLEGAFSVIQTQDQVIQTEIENQRTVSVVMAAAVFVLALVLVLVFSLFLASSISRSIRSLVSGLGVICDGDLTKRLTTRSRDEIGALAVKFDSLLEDLDSGFHFIQESSKKNVELKDRLIQSVSEVSSAVIEIEANSASITKQVEKMDQFASKTALAIGEVTAVAKRFTERAHQQDVKVEDTAGTVLEILKSIDLVMRDMESDKSAANGLVMEADEGGVVLTDAFVRIDGIGESVEKIQEMADVIASIASQTSILAMNAAIEAAHAGEYGKGFSVVADEIRKLADESASSSDEINRTIQEIVSRILEAQKSGRLASTSFQNIGQKIKIVSDSIGKIHDTVNVIKGSGSNVALALEDLNSVSNLFVVESVALEGQVEEMQPAILDASRITHEVFANISEIAQGLNDIARISRVLSAQTEGIDELGKGLELAVSRFQTTGQSASEV